MRQTADITREILGIEPGTRDRRVSVIVSIKSEGNLSYWGLIKHFDGHPDDLDLCELSSQYHTLVLSLHIIDPAVLQRIMAKMDGEDAVYGTLLVDSSGFSIAKYKDWKNAKYGKLSVRQFVKLHIIPTLHSMVCAATATPTI